MATTINIDPDELQTQINRLNTLYHTCQGHKPDDISQQGDGSSIRAINLIHKEYTALQAAMAALIDGTSGFFQHTLDAMSESDKAAARLFASEHRTAGGKGLSKTGPTLPGAEPESAFPAPRPAIPKPKPPLQHDTGK